MGSTIHADEAGITVQSRFYPYIPLYFVRIILVEAHPNLDEILNYDYVCSSRAYVVKLIIDEVL